MAMDFKNYIYLAVILALLFLFGREMVNHRSDDKANETKIAFLDDRIDSLEASKTNYTVVYDTIEKYITQYRTKYYAVDSVKVYEIIDGRVADASIDVGDEIYSKIYEDTLRTEDFTLPYTIKVWGGLDYIGFSKYTLNRKTEIIEHIVNVPVDVIKEINKNHLYIYGMFGTEWSNGNTFSYEGGLNLIIKNKVGFSVGYQRYGELNFIKGGLSLKII